MAQYGFSSQYQHSMDHVASLLSRLAALVPMQLWMVTRTRGNHWIVLQSHDHGYGISNGEVFQWCDSFCSRMVRGEGPHIAPDADAVDAYVEAPIGRQVTIGSYIGVPLLRRDHSLFGTLCAIDPATKDPALQKQLPVVQDFAGAISGLLRLAEMDEAEARQDLLRQHDLRRDLLGFYDVQTLRETLPTLQSKLAPLGIGARVISVELSERPAVRQRAGNSWTLDISAPILLRDWATRRQAISSQWTHHTYLIINLEHNAERTDEELADLSAALDQIGVASVIRWTRLDEHRTLQDALLACMRPGGSDGCQVLESASH